MDDGVDEPEVEYYERTYSLKVKDGIYAWIYDDGTERFPGVTFKNPEEAQVYHEKLYGRTYIKFEPKA